MTDFPQHSATSRDWNPLFIAVVWAICIWLINPIGDFPLNDDWAYGVIVKKWLEEGTFQLINWGEMTLVSHITHGLVAGKLFGFSFTVLRFSTLFIALLGLIGVYQLGLVSGLERRSSLLFSLVVLVNPVYMSLSFSYMTDVPFMAISVWSIYFFIKADKTDSTKYLVWGIVLCVWALLSRQLALLIPFSWLIAHIVVRGKKRSWTWKIAPFATVLVTYFIFNLVMGYYDLLSDTYGSKLGVLKGFLMNPNLRLVKNTAGYILLFTAYIGLFLAPFLPFYKWAMLKRRDWMFMIAYTLIVSMALVLMGKAIPSIDNVFIDFGVGPTTMMDHYGDFRSAPDGGAAPMILKAILTFVGSFGGGVIVLSIFKWIRDKEVFQGFKQTFVFAFVVLYMTPFMITGYYDRYVILIVPLVAIFLAKYIDFKGMRHRSKIAYSLLFVFSLFSTLATHDYLSWNRVRWEVIENLRASGIADKNIGGGVEFEGWFLFRNDDLEWYKREDPEYKITFKPVLGHTVVSEHEYSRWLPGKKSIYLNKKQKSSNE